MGAAAAAPPPATRAPAPRRLGLRSWAPAPVAISVARPPKSGRISVRSVMAATAPALSRRFDNMAGKAAPALAFGGGALAEQPAMAGAPGGAAMSAAIWAR